MGIEWLLQLSRLCWSPYTSSPRLSSPHFRPSLGSTYSANCATYKSHPAPLTCPPPCSNDAWGPRSAALSQSHSVIAAPCLASQKHGNGRDAAISLLVHGQGKNTERPWSGRQKPVHRHSRRAGSQAEHPANQEASCPYVIREQKWQSNQRSSHNSLQQERGGSS
jgi:hypothetical protein